MVRFLTAEQPVVLETSSNEPLFSEQKNRTEEERFLKQAVLQEQRFLKQAATNHCFLNRRTEQQAVLETSSPCSLLERKEPLKQGFVSKRSIRKTRNKNPREEHFLCQEKEETQTNK